jgi:hypothetical protein
MDIARGELVERELDTMIERRTRQKDPEEVSEAWQESTRRYNTRRREATASPGRTTSLASLGLSGRGRRSTTTEHRR